MREAGRDGFAHGASPPAQPTSRRDDTDDEEDDEEDEDIDAIVEKYKKWMKMTPLQSRSSVDRPIELKSHSLRTN